MGERDGSSGLQGGIGGVRLKVRERKRNLCVEIDGWILVVFGNFDLG